MSRSILARYLTPWTYRREQEAARVAELRDRDGDACRRCRRPLRFDLPRGHELAPRIEHLGTRASGAEPELADQCLCHARCNAGAVDRTREVQERRRRENEAKLLSRGRR
jgi:hypothetical protein